MFQLNQVACAYEQKKVFTGLDLEIRQGQYVMLMGENGTGKSSLISLLTCLLYTSELPTNSLV